MLLGKEAQHYDGAEAGLERREGTMTYGGGGEGLHHRKITRQRKWKGMATLQGANYHFLNEMTRGTVLCVLWFLLVDKGPFRKSSAAHGLDQLGWLKRIYTRRADS